MTFPDLPEVITEGKSRCDAREMAADALGVVLLTYLEHGKALPEAGTGATLIAPDITISAKIALIEAFRAAGIPQSELARRLGKDEKEIRRILDPSHATKIGPLEDALGAMGMHTVLGFQAAE